LAAQQRLAGSVTSHLQKLFYKMRPRTLTLAAFATAFDAILAEVRWLAMVRKSRDRGKSAGPMAGQVQALAESYRRLSRRSQYV
jgi:hypothetical protein